MLTDPFSLLVAGKLLDSAWDVFSDPVKKYVEKLLAHKSPGQPAQAPQLERADGVAAGVAIGYFHNFLKPLDETIAQERLLVFATELKRKSSGFAFTQEQMDILGPEGAKQMGQEKTETHTCLENYDADHFNLVIVFPTTLDPQNFNRVNDYIRGKTRPGSYYYRPNGRPYGLSFNLVDADKIIIEDYARPIEAIGKYYAEEKRYSPLEIEQIQKEEIELFLATIYRLCKGNTRHIFSKTKLLAIE